MTDGWHIVRLDHIDFGALEVAVGPNAKVAWLTFIGPRGGRHVTIAIRPSALDDLAATLTLAAVAIRKNRPPATPSLDEAAVETG